MGDSLSGTPATLRAGSPWRFGRKAALAVAAMLAAGLAFYIWQRHAAVEPPAVAFDGMDPAIVALIQQSRDAVLASPRSGPAWGKLGMVFLAYDRQDEARACFAHAEQLDPLQFRWPYFHGLSLSLTDPEAALGYFRRAVELCDDTATSPRLRLADLLLRLGRRDEAELQYQAVLGKPPERAAVDPESARRAYEHERARAHLGLARVAFEREQLQRSMNHAVAAVEDPATASAAHALLAEIHQRLGDTAAVDKERRLVGLDPPNPSPLADPIYQEVDDLKLGKDADLTKASLLLREGQAGKVVHLLKKTVETYPDCDEAWLKLGYAQLLLGELPASKRSLRQALKLRRSLVDGHLALGMAQLKEGSFASAADSFRRVTELKPDHALGHMQLGVCLQRQGQRAAAIEAFRSACRAKPNLADAHLQLGEMLAQDGKTAEALEHLRAAVELNPGDEKAKRLLYMTAAKRTGAGD